jgi:hypothetical protein
MDGMDWIGPAARASTPTPENDENVTFRGVFFNSMRRAFVAIAVTMVATMASAQAAQTTFTFKSSDDEKLPSSNPWMALI